MKTALYIRVSTLDQNPDAQRRELEEYAARHEWPVVEVFEDRASGADTKRPALVRLLDAARKGKIETVLVWKLDRFGRSMIDLLDNMVVLETERVRFIAVTQGIDTGADYSNPSARFFFHILAAVAELERGIIRERVQSGMKRYQKDLADGKIGKTVHTRSGKDLPPGRTRRVFDIERVKALQANGANLCQISRQIGVPRATIQRRLQLERERSQTNSKTATASQPGAAELERQPLSRGLGPEEQGK
jgi:putative DNA-invertase from lambdoid prophage Rac